YSKALFVWLMSWSSLLMEHIPCAFRRSKVDVELNRPLPLPIDHVIVEPDRAGQKTDVFSKIMVHSEAPTADVVLAAGIISREHPLVVFVTFLIFDLPEAIVVPDHASGILMVCSCAISTDGDWRPGHAPIFIHQDRPRI